ncbi:MAG: hypothetical protein AAF441_27570 [Pseudomonadota bacterium]
MRRFTSAFVWLLSGCMWFAAGDAGARAGDEKPTIYDSRVLERMEFSPEQRREIKAILKRSDQEMLEIFARYGIDPQAKPSFDKLREARHELQALESREKRQMKKVMTRTQFKYYLGLLQQTAARVIKATRNRP